MKPAMLTIPRNSLRQPSPEVIFSPKARVAAQRLCIANPISLFENKIFVCIEKKTPVEHSPYRLASNTSPINQSERKAGVYNVFLAQ